MTSVDPESYNLACHFLTDEPHITDDQRNRLAAHIQNAVEDWFKAEDARTERERGAE